MSKKKEEVKEVKPEAPAPVEAAKPVEAPAKARGIPGLYIGLTVHYFKEIPQNSGKNKLEECAAIVAKYSDQAAGNFKPEDGAVNLTVFISHGGAVESRFGVLYSPEPRAGRWSFIKIPKQ